MKRRIVLVGAVCVMCGTLGGCGNSSGVVKFDNSMSTTQVLPASVRILTAKPSRPHEEIAYVYASCRVMPLDPASADTAGMENLRDEAASIGADAIYQIERGTLSGSETGPGFTSIQPDGNGGAYVFGGQNSTTKHIVQLRAIAIRFTDGGPGATPAPKGWKKPYSGTTPGDS